MAQARTEGLITAVDIGSSKVAAVIAQPTEGGLQVLGTGQRESKGVKDVALVRVEQLYPFPEKSLNAQLGRYPNAEVVWCQEEPKNMGAWNFVDRRIEAVLANLKVKARRPVYVGRPEAASPATGLYKRHNREQASLVDQALAPASAARAAE